MSMTRRSLMRLLGMGAASAAAAPALSKAQVAQAAGMNPAMVGVVGPSREEARTLVAGSRKPSAAGAVHEAMQRARYRNMGHVEMSISIRNKKSWSDTFKQSCAQAEAEFWEEASLRVRRNEEVAANLCRALGIPFDEDDRRQHIPFARPDDF